MPALPLRRPQSATPAKPAPTERKSAKAKSTGVIRLSVGAFQDWLSSWDRFTWIVAIVAVPLQLIGLAQGTSSTNPGGTAYTYIAIFVLNAALLWATLIFGRTGRAPRAAVAYYDGSVTLVRLAVILLLFVLMLIPLTIGLALYIAGAVAGATVELIAIMLVSLLIALPSLYMIIRFGLAFFVAADTGLRPIAALSAARALTIGKFWGITRRYLGLLIYMLLLAVPAGVLSSLLTHFGHAALGTFLFGIITTVVLLPIFDLYLLRMYRSLQPKTDPDTAA